MDKRDTDQPAGMRTLVSDCFARCLESLIPTDAAYIHVHAFAIVQLGHAHAQKRLFWVNAQNTVFSSIHASCDLHVRSHRHYLARDARKPVFGVSDKVRFKTSLLSYKD